MLGTKQIERLFEPGPALFVLRVQACFQGSAGQDLCGAFCAYVGPRQAEPAADADRRAWSAAARGAAERWAIIPLGANCTKRFAGPSRCAWLLLIRPYRCGWGQVELLVCTCADSDSARFHDRMNAETT